MRSFVAVAVAGLLIASCGACSTSSAVAGRATMAVSGATADRADDVTLRAATVAAQETLDRFAAADFAGVWELMTKKVRDGITEQDFVTFYRTCKKAGPAIHVTGFRLEDDDEAIVRMVVGGVEQFRIMAYENGSWAMEPTDEFASHLGQPVAQIVAEETVDGHCDR